MGNIDFDKFVVSLYKGCLHSGSVCKDNIDAALKEQGLEIILDKVVPIEDGKEQKFKKGDWVVLDDGRVGKVVHYTEDFTDVSFGCSHMSIGTGRIRRWTIQDAKAGDVLLSDTGQPFIFNGYIDNDRFLLCGSYCGINSVGNFVNSSTNTWTHIKNVVPADITQRAVLISKMNDAGYRWNAEECRLDNISSKEPMFKIGDVIRYSDTENDILYTISGIEGPYYINSQNGRMDIAYTDVHFKLVPQSEDINEFDQELEYWFGQVLCSYENGGCDVDNMDEYSKEYSKKSSYRLLNIAKKQLLKEADNLSNCNDEVKYKKGYLNAVDDVCVYLHDRLFWTDDMIDNFKEMIQQNIKTK